MAIDWDNPVIKNIPNIIGIIFLLFVLAYLAVKFGYARCCDIPGFCGLYYMIDGTPEVAIVYEYAGGEYAIGDPEMLENSLIQRKNVFPAMLPIETIVSANMLDNYKVIFVEAKNIDTATLERFRSFVNHGGKLVWIGDSGTGIGENDYICQEVTFKYLAAASGGDTTLCDVLPDKEEYKLCTAGTCSALEGTAKTLCENAAAGKRCADSWADYTPDDPQDMEAGLCGETFGDIVVKYYNEREELKKKLTTGGLEFCESEEDSFKVQNADNIEACLELLGSEITSANANSLCIYEEGVYNYGANYWNRGPSETLTGEYVPAVNFANVLGIDIIKDAESEYLTLLPIDTKHSLTSGYGTKTFFGTAPVTKVSTTRFPIRSNTILSICFDTDCKSDVWPAIVVSNPTGPGITKSGLVVYFAFPPESQLEDAKTGKGANFINNLVDYALCA